MNVTKKIKMDLAHKENIQCIDVVQGDAYTRKIEFSLFENGQKWMIPDLVSVAISYRGGSGSGIYDKLPDETPAFEISENIVTITIVPQAISASGNTNVSVLFSDENGKQLSTFSVVLNSVQNPATGAGEPKDYYNIREWVGAGPLWVNVTKNDNGQYVSDKTISQIQVANKGGRSVYCILKIDENDNMQLPMTNVESNAFVFSALINGEEWSVNFDAHEITVSCAPVVIVLSQSRNLSENATASTSETGMVNASSGWFGRVKAGETYTFSADFHKPVDAGSKNIGVRVYSAKSGGTNLQEKTLSYSSVPVGSTKRLSGTFTATGDGYVSLNGSFGTLDDVFKSFEIATNIQLEAGEVATEYIPYGVKEVLNAERVLNTEKKVAELEETVSEIDKRTEPYVISESRNLSEQATASTTATGMLNTSCGWFGHVKAGQVYTFSADFHKPADAGSKNIGVRVYDKETGKNNIQETVVAYSSVPVGSTKRLSGTFTATGDGYVSLNGSFGTLDDVFKSFEIATNIQLEAGEVATEYIPYGVKEVLNAERVLNTEKKVAELEETVSEIDKRTEPYVISESRNLSEQATASTTATGMLNTSCGWFGHVKAGQVYTFSADFHKPADAGSKNIGVRVYDKETGKNNIQETVVAYSSVPVGGTKRLSGTFTAIGDGYVSMNGNFRIDNAPIEGFSSYEIATNIQLEEGEVATEYKPYGEKITVDGEFVADLAQRMEDVEEAVTEGVKVGAYASHVKSVAHQGASGFGYPQNTVENIIACAKHGWKLAEFDVIWTSDNVPVISHDDARTIYGSAETITISTSTYEDVAAARLFEDASMKISTFYEAIDACKLYGLTAVIEIKGSLTSARLDDLVAYLKRRNMLRKCAWISFNLDPLVQVRNRDPKADVLLCLSQAKDTTWVDGESRLSTLLEGEGETVLNYSRNALSGVEDLETYLNGMREYGFLIGAWTIDTAEVVQQYAPYLDYITSNVYKVEDVLA